jgi:hypothetical protein
MILKNGQLSVGGNSILVWIGNIILNIGKSFSKSGTSMIENNKTRYVTNPSAKLFNPFTLNISFTVDVNDKYEVTLKGDYKQKYIEGGDIELSEKEMFMIIYQNQKMWFKKD